MEARTVAKRRTATLYFNPIDRENVIASSREFFGALQTAEAGCVHVLTCDLRSCWIYCAPSCCGADVSVGLDAFSSPHVIFYANE